MNDMPSNDAGRFDPAQKEEDNHSAAENIKNLIGQELQTTVGGNPDPEGDTTAAESVEDSGSVEKVSTPDGLNSEEGLNELENDMNALDEMPAGDQQGEASFSAGQTGKTRGLTGADSY